MKFMKIIFNFALLFVANYSLEAMDQGTKSQSFCYGHKAYHTPIIKGQHVLCHSESTTQDLSANNLVIRLKEKQARVVSPLFEDGSGDRSPKRSLDKCLGQHADSKYTQQRSADFKGFQPRTRSVSDDEAFEELARQYIADKKNDYCPSTPPKSSGAKTVHQVSPNPKKSTRKLSLIENCIKIAWQIKNIAQHYTIHTEEDIEEHYETELSHTAYTLQEEQRETLLIEIATLQLWLQRVLNGDEEVIIPLSFATFVADQADCKATRTSFSQEEIIRGLYSLFEEVHSMIAQNQYEAALAIFKNLSEPVSNLLKTIQDDVVAQSDHPLHRSSAFTYS